MATCQEIITQAMRMCGVLGFGRDPKAAEASEGMLALQSLYDTWRTGGMFGELEDVFLDEDDTAEEGKRYLLDSGVTLTAATNEIEDVGTGETRQPYDLALYESLTSAGTQTARLYDRIAWVDLLGLELADTAPLSGRDARGLAACLAVDTGFIDTFGGQIPSRVERLASNFRRSIMGKKGSTQAETSGTYF